MERYWNIYDAAFAYTVVRDFACMIQMRPLHNTQCSAEFQSYVEFINMGQNPLKHMYINGVLMMGDEFCICAHVPYFLWRKEFSNYCSIYLL